MFEAVVHFANEQRAIIHLFLHVLLPLGVALVFTKGDHWKCAFALMMATMLVDVDHLLATPIYVPDRCSILFHPLHQLIPIFGYVLMALWPVGKKYLKQSLKPLDKALGWIGLGLLIHMLLDALDCLWMNLS
ncbi:MAG: hypothetical protein JXR16_13680 [Bermanella sp.]